MPLFSWFPRKSWSFLRLAPIKENAKCFTLERGAWDSVSCDQTRDSVFRCVAERPVVNTYPCVQSISQCLLSLEVRGQSHKILEGIGKEMPSFGGRGGRGALLQCSLLRSRFWDMSGGEKFVYLILFQNVSKHTVISCRFMLRKFMS